MVASAVLALLGLTVGAATAAAAEPIDVTEGDLIIHKYEQPNVPGDAGDGTELSGATTAGWVAMEGVEFTVQQVIGVDLNTNEGWAVAAEQVTDLAAATNKDSWVPTCSSCSLTTKGVKDTTNLGVAAFEDLPVGLYLVKETGYNGGKWDEANIKKSQPFLVTIPLADPTTGGWNDVVHVYPKNIVSTIEKTVDDTNLTQVGDKVSFKITTTVPSGTLTKYVIEDPLDPGLSFTGVPSVTYSGDNTTKATLNPGTDYTVVPTVGDPAVGEPGAQVKVTLTATGIDKISAALLLDGTVKVATTIETILNEDGIDGVTNSASYTFNDGTADTKVETGTGGEVEIKMGSHSFVKLDANAKSTFLSGAKFKVYVTKTKTFDAATAKQITGLTGMNPQNELVSSDPAGTFSAAGMRYSEWGENGNLDCPLTGSATPDDACLYYWLVETEAPAGYQPLAAPVPFMVSDSTDETEVGNVLTSSITGTLPLTGMSGIILLLLPGALILGGAGYGLYRLSKTTKA